MRDFADDELEMEEQERQIEDLRRLNSLLEDQNRKLRVLLSERLGRMIQHDGLMPVVMYIGPQDMRIYPTAQAAIDATLRQMS